MKIWPRHKMDEQNQNNVREELRQFRPDINILCDLITSGQLEVQI